jgi:hypothetical protein
VALLGVVHVTLVELDWAEEFHNTALRSTELSPPTRFLPSCCGRLSCHATVYTDDTGRYLKDCTSMKVRNNVPVGSLKACWNPRWQFSCVCRLSVILLLSRSSGLILHIKLYTSHLTSESSGSTPAMYPEGREFKYRPTNRLP